MKRLTTTYPRRVTAFLIAAGLAIGCAPSDGKAEVAEKKQEVAEAMQEYAFAQKNEYIERMDKDLDAIKVEIDRLSQRADNSSSAAKADAKLKMEAVSSRWRQARAQLDQATDASEAGWDNMKSSFKKSYRDLEEALSESRQWMNEKLEP